MHSFKNKPKPTVTLQKQAQTKGALLKTSPNQWYPFEDERTFGDERTFADERTFEHEQTFDIVRTFED